MRSTSLVTISMPPEMVAESEKVAEKKHMTRSELLRAALRFYLEEASLEEAMYIAEKELASGRAKKLAKGGLVRLMRK